MEVRWSLDTAVVAAARERADREGRSVAWIAERFLASYALDGTPVPLDVGATEDGRSALTIHGPDDS